MINKKVITHYNIVNICSVLSSSLKMNSSLVVMSQYVLHNRLTLSRYWRPLVTARMCGRWCDWRRGSVLPWSSSRTPQSTPVTPQPLPVPKRPPTTPTNWLNRPESLGSIVTTQWLLGVGVTIH